MISPKANQSEEKAQAMLNRWWKMKRMLYQKPQHERPGNSKNCNSISKCDRWRQDIIKEICDKVSEIQNAGLGEFKIRALNDEINKLLNEKRHWDRRIKELGGPDYAKLEKKLYDRDGVELPGSGGYKYFGAAKDLPGVRDLFYREPPTAPSKNINELYKRIDYSYYGFGIDMVTDSITGETEDELIALERQLEERETEEQTNRWLKDNYEEVMKKAPEVEHLTYDQTIAKLKKGELNIFSAEMEEESDQEEKHIHEMEQQKQQDMLERMKRELIDTFVDGDEIDIKEREILRNLNNGKLT